MADAATARILSVDVDGATYGVPAEHVREVALLPMLTRVPLAPPALLGLANVRGNVVPVLSLAALVSRAPGGETRLVVVEDGETVGLAVDRVSRLAHNDESVGIGTIDIARLVAEHTPPSRTARVASGGARVSAPARETAASQLALVTFAISKQEFAFPLDAVDTVTRVPDDVAHMPHADAAVLGSVLLRGMLLPVLSLRHLLALEGTDSARSRLVVVRIGAHRVGLVVDAMRTVVRVSEADIDAVPQVLLRGGAEARVQAICRIGGTRLISILAADQLLRDDISARLLKDTQVNQASEQSGEEQATEQFLLFEVGSDAFGLPIEAVEEVALLPPRLTRFPKAPAFVQGVMDLRGRAVPVIDQALRFGSASASGKRRRVIVVQLGDLSVGFAVDRVSDVFRATPDILQPAPNLGDDQTLVFDRVATIPSNDGESDRVVLIVSPRELLDRAEADVLREAAGGLKTSTR